MCTHNRLSKCHLTIVDNYLFNMLLKAIILAVLSLIGNCENEKPIVETSAGKLRGYYKISHGGKTFSAFEGVPYAKPPVGRLRFEEPQPLEPWTGIWNAVFLYECAQIFSKHSSNVSEGMIISGDEDCLYLNIYVPRDHPNPQEELDVIVHIHGGAYMSGSGHVYAHPGYLMDKNVIFVTFNYRLGILGFLSTGDAVLPGNNGLKDQVMALKWIQNNIASFGGNPDSVTITGASAGGSSVHLHYFSPMSKGLFHRGSSQSGNALAPWALQKGASNKTKMLASAVGCPESPSESLVKCLKERTYREILNTITLFYAYKFEPVVAFGPVVEKGANPFLADDPYVLLLQRRVHDLPWLTSNVAQEGKFFTALTFANNITEINQDWEKSAPFVLYYNYTAEPSQRQSLAKKIKDAYLGENQEVTSANFGSLVKVFSDRMFIDSGVEAAKLQAGVSTSPVYYYYFNYLGDHGTSVQHADDNQYFFSVTDKEPSQNELRMKDVMVDMLVSYANTSKPTIDGLTWESTKSDQLTFLNISGFANEDMKLKSTEYIADHHFWKSLGLMEEPITLV